MFGKVVNIFVVFVFLLSTVGITISKHYCGNELVIVSIDSEANSCCDLGDRCCHTESEHFQINENFLGQIFSADFSDDGNDLFFAFSFITLQPEHTRFEKQEFELTDIPPPHKIQTTLSLLQTYLC